MKTKTLEEMISESCYDEIVSNLKTKVGEHNFKFVFPLVKKALETGSGEEREKILIDWLDVTTCRVCSNCGAIMEEGWYMESKGYACSDKCAKEIMGVPTMKLFRRYRIYKEDIDEYLKNEGKGRKEEDLTQKEIEEIIEIVSSDMESCYTEWY